MLRYVGIGTFLWGVPARDLQDSEAEVYGIDGLLASGLYERVTPDEKATRPKGEDKSLRPFAENKETK